MDHYISEFYKWVGNCTVEDYGVYLEKKTGFDRFNPFSTQEQLTLFLTDRGVFCVRIQGAGVFCSPETPENAGLSVEGKTVSCAATGKQYRFVRKWAGSAGGFETFLQKLRSALR